MIILDIHSVVDVITNSSTTIYTYQNSINATKALVQEILKLTGETDKSPDDVFYYGVFCTTYDYIEFINDSVFEYYFDAEDINEEELENLKRLSELSSKELLSEIDKIKEGIMKSEIKKPYFFELVEDPGTRGDYESLAPSTKLHLIVKNEKYNAIAETIKNMLNSISADGLYNG